MGEAKDILDRRLAAGEISVEEYSSRLAALEGSSSSRQPPQVPPAPPPKVLASFDDLVITERGLFISGKLIPLERIAKVNGSASQMSINFIPMMKDSSLHIELTDGTTFSYSEDSAYFSPIRHKQIRTAYAILRSATSQKRLDNLAAKVRRDGRVLLGLVDFDEKKPVYLTVRGELVSGELVVVLKIANANGGFGIGVEGRSLGLSRSVDPDMIVASLNPAGRFTLPRGAIKFTATQEDKDAVANLLQWLAKPGNDL
jgi:hypothetical protein